MDGFISRNGLAAMFFLGLIMFGVSNLVGSEDEDGLLMKVAQDLTGETDAAPAETDGEQPAPTPAPAPAAPTRAQPTSSSDFFEDADLVNTAAGYDPTPDAGETTQPELDSDEAMIVPQPSVPRRSSGESEDGMLVEDGALVGPVSFDDDDE